MPKVPAPRKGCVSTAMPLCHWPCSCYPNHAMGQSGDWMNELYPRHLRGRAFSVVVHGDAAGAENLRHSLSDWLSDIGLIPAGSQALLDRYIGYYAPYAESHEYLDRDLAFQAEARNAALALVSRIAANRAGQGLEPVLPEPRTK